MAFKDKTSIGADAAVSPHPNPLPRGEGVRETFRPPESRLTKIMLPVSFQFRGLSIFAFKVEARLSIVGESKEREGFDDDSIEREGRRSSHQRLQAGASWLLWLNPQDCHQSGTDFSL